MLTADQAYQALGLPRGCSLQQIRRSYYRLAIRHHPDPAAADDAAFKQIKQAYEYLQGSVVAKSDRAAAARDAHFEAEIKAFEDELQRPLEVSDDFLARYREQVRDDQRREASDEGRHLTNMASLQASIERKDALAARSSDYKVARSRAEAEAARRRQLLLDAGDDEEKLLRAEEALHEAARSPAAAAEAKLELDLLSLIAAGQGQD